MLCIRIQVLFLRTVGGTSTSNVVFRCWDKVIGTEAKAACNWLGKPRNGQRKHALKDSRVTKAMYVVTTIFGVLRLFCKTIFIFTGGIRGTHQFRNVQESELIVETKKAFKHAPERARNAAAVAGTK